MLTGLAAAMLLPALVDLMMGYADWQVFAASALVTLFCGVSLMLTTQGKRTTVLNLRQAFLLTTLIWVVVALFGALPFMFSDLELSYTDAFFEAMSGVTTTGSTVIVGLDNTAPGLLLWRALLQWLGGIGIVVMAMGLLPMLSVGGMQMFKTEAFDTPEKVLPRAARFAGWLSLVYVGITALCALALYIAGMSGFDAIAHAMTTIATGGYSTKDASVGHFNSASVDWIITAGMILGSLPFIAYLKMLRGDSRMLLHDSQIRWFLTIALSAGLVATIWQVAMLSAHPLDALRYAFFNCVSVLTGTGFATTDFSQWGGFAMSLMLFLMFIGGCAGSTTCGIKIFRVQIAYATAGAQLGRLLRPHGVFIPHFNRKPIPDEVSNSVMGFLVVYMLCFLVLAMVLGALGLDFVTAVSGAATAISNVGPGLGDVIGPAGNFSTLPDAAKWALSLAMLMGRLELFTVLILLAPSFWRG
ncbi:MAG: TrkH family potassium uptake protein [Alphaproteobacteria bacterium]|nr:TrkH family potassium uptake protein [Alphaproteobacteria bacterium]MBU0799278.1 TrkH family potassium uptake protein [Alphaproteobacteria bacterium]MBU0888879.1 TrkH family potassium uptake protein [Alphaproteobacteria bacterium]MBU1813899.1 TrkH family potassium uptake protein [Alphaproteobacteria bacterium]MBU2090181.1 TrkH family potassium uptake protein [Alphaproteobacteria bacterium]